MEKAQSFILAYPSLQQLRADYQIRKFGRQSWKDFQNGVRYREDLSLILLLQTVHFRKLTVIIFDVLLSRPCWIYRLANILIFCPSNLGQGQDLNRSLFTFDLGEITSERYERTFCSSSNSFKFQRFSFRLIRLDHFNSFQLQTVTFKIFMVAQL